MAVTITPLDPATLAPVPSPYRANGNVYLVAMAYQPSRVAVTRLAGAGASMVLIVPEVGKSLFTTPVQPRAMDLGGRPLHPARPT